MSVAAYAKQVGGKKEARRVLRQEGIKVIAEMFDPQMLEAAHNTPLWLSKTRRSWGLSHTTGLGAVKHELDPLKINITQHVCRGPQWLMLQGPSNRKTFVKMYYKGALSARSGTAHYRITNFLRDNAPDYYLCACFEGPHLWAISAKVLKKKWDNIRATAANAIPGFRIPVGREGHEGGVLTITFRVDKADYVLDAPAKLGL
jgi:hypothetical protein